MCVCMCMCVNVWIGARAHQLLSNFVPVSGDRVFVVTDTYESFSQVPLIFILASLLKLSPRSPIWNVWYFTLLLATLEIQARFFFFSFLFFFFWRRNAGRVVTCHFSIVPFYTLVKWSNGGLLRKRRTNVSPDAGRNIPDFRFAIHSPVPLWNRFVNYSLVVVALFAANLNLSLSVPRLKLCFTLIYHLLFVQFSPERSFARKDLKGRRRW